MKAEDIKEFGLGEPCFGPILRVNGKEYEDLSKEDVIEFINDMLLNDLNKENLLMETFRNCLEMLQFDSIESTTDRCDQCSNYNYY